MALVQNHIVDDSIVFVSYQNSGINYQKKMAHIVNARRNDPRLDSAICMPSTKKSTAVYTPSKDKKNESLERWVDDLLKELDHIMSTNLNIDPNQNNSQRVKELIKKIDERLSNTVNDADIDSIREFVLEKKDECELLLKNASILIKMNECVHETQSDDSTIEISSDDINIDNTISVEKLNEKLRECNIKTVQDKKNPIKRAGTFLSRAATIAKKRVDKGIKLPQKSDKTLKFEEQAQKRIATARSKGGNSSTNIGTIEKKSKHERLLNGRYLIDKRDSIGEGHHGKVVKGIDIETKERVAVKCLKKQYTCSLGKMQYADKKQKKKNQEILHEGKMMLRMQGLSNLVQLIDLVETSKKVYYVMPLANKDLSDVIYRRRMTEHCARELMKPIFEAVKALHDSGFVHRDIKPENIMLYQGGFAKLGDFGLSTEFGYHSGLQVVGTPAFAAPEVLGQFHRTEKLAWLNYKRADLWSLGATLYVCLAGRYPFDDQSPVPEQAAAGIQFPEKRFKHYSSEAIDLIKKLMIVDPFKRISIDDALNHPFFTKS
ncbi:kinase-like domain-containing protein [Glomus cerebriforme]|uniref:Kinase-like domain-containing protein n=1 Tax=Glomus cerebriforme TaxID=658196 RepID=A0A397TEW3_9GLOM|nr:kinase-like domain-containing protein [Glomus cerebriforme]